MSAPFGWLLVDALARPFFLTSCFRKGETRKSKTMMDYDDPRFSAAEVAQFIDVKPGFVRDMRDRGLSQYFGTKLDHYVEYSVRETAMIAVTRDLVKLGFPVRMAAQASASLLERAPALESIFVGGPEEIAHLTPTQTSNFALHRELISAPDVRAARIEIPIGKIWHETVKRCASIEPRAASL